MDKVVIASNQADAEAAEAVERHHAAMAGELALRVETLLGAVASGDARHAEEARGGLAGWCRHELVPHALAEEKTMYPAALGTTEGRLLVEGMLAEHQVIVGLVEQLEQPGKHLEPVRAAAAARALQVMFDSHLAKENELVLPLLVAAPGVSVADLLGGMHELLGGEEGHADAVQGETGGCGGHGCACGDSDPAGYPELDARSVPHALRHATIFGALDTVGAGGGMVLVAPHDPLPLLAQVEQRAPGRFEVSYLERGPEAWRLLFTRRTPA